MPDHFYTLNNATPASYKEEGISCIVFGRDQPEISTVGVYRYYNSSNGDHFYTTDKGVGNQILNQGYKIENGGEPECYIFNSNVVAGTVPLYQWCNGTDHFYTTHPTGELAPLIGGLYQGILGYVFPANAQVVGSRKPLYRFYKP